MSWELHCPVCHRSSLDGWRDDESAERCPVCGLWPALESEPVLGDETPSSGAFE